MYGHQVRAGSNEFFCERLRPFDHQVHMKWFRRQRSNRRNQIREKKQPRDEMRIRCVNMKKVSALLHPPNLLS
jgi:hypothetical protein